MLLAEQHFGTIRFGDKFSGRDPRQQTQIKLRCCFVARGGIFTHILLSGYVLACTCVCHDARPAINSQTLQEMTIDF